MTYDSEVFRESALNIIKYNYSMQKCLSLYYKRRFVFIGYYLLRARKERVCLRSEAVAFCATAFVSVAFFFAPKIF